MISGISINSSVKENTERPLKFKSVLLSVVMVISLWALIMVFCFVLPSIAGEVVHKSDREILARVERVAIEAALTSSVASAVFVLCLRKLLVTYRGGWGGRRKSGTVVP